MTEITDKQDAAPTERETHGLFSLLVERPVLTLMITIAMVLVGAMSLARLPLTFMGEGMTASSINVMVSVGRARSPRENEDKVARPTEALFRTIAGLSGSSATRRNNSDRSADQLRPAYSACP